MSICRVCLKPVDSDPPYHAKCLRELFGTARLPGLDFYLRELYALATEMAGKMSISGAQEKVSLRLSRDHRRLEVAAAGGRYILKPQPARFVHIPENEHLTMRLAGLVGIELPPFGLVELKDGQIAYLIKRFDRLDDGGKLHVEDFCQLDEKPMREKYQGSGELCTRILRKYASEPLIEIRKLFKLLLFSWWVSNGDQHLKNFSLVITPNGCRRLSPAYDLICTRLPIPTDCDLALTICGKRNNLALKDWLDFADYCDLPQRVADRLIAEQVDALNPSMNLIEASFLPEDLKSRYKQLVIENTRLIS